MMKLIKQQLRYNLENLKLANYNMRLGNYKDAVDNLKKSQQHLMSVESINQFAEKQILKN